LQASSSAACRRLEITPAAGDAAAATNVGNSRRERGCPDEELAELDQDSGAVATEHRNRAVCSAACVGERDGQTGATAESGLLSEQCKSD